MAEGTSRNGNATQEHLSRPGELGDRFGCLGSASADVGVDLEQAGAKCRLHILGRVRHLHQSEDPQEQGIGRRRIAEDVEGDDAVSEVSTRHADQSRRGGVSQPSGM